MGFWRKWLLLVIVVGLGAPGIAGAARIDSLIVQGNFRSNEGLIRATSGLAVGDEITLPQIQAAIRNIYAVGMFSDVVIKHETLGYNREKIIIEVTEFPILNTLTITGNKKIKKDDLLKKIRILTGQIVNPQSLTRAIDDILKEYRDKGYYLARVVPEQTPAGEGRVDVNLVITEGDRVQVKRIRFIGAEAFPQSKLRDQMDTKEDRWWRSADFNEEKYREDKEKVLKFYRKQGYREASIVKDSVYLDDSKKNLFIDITIDQGVQYHYGNITWHGNALLSDEQVHRLLRLKEGDVYNREAFDEAVFRLASAYQEQGYWGVDPGSVESPRHDTIDVAFNIIEGEPSQVHFIDIVGNDKTKDKVIRREMTLVPGEIFRRSDLERSHRNVFYLNYFEDVTPDIKPQATGDVDVILTVKEKPTGTVNMAVGYGETDKWVGSIGLSIPNLMGNGQQLDFQWEFGQSRTSFYLSFTEPWLFDTPTSGTITFFNIKRELDVTEESRGFSVQVGRRLRWPDDYSRVYTSYSFRTERYTFPTSFTDEDKRAYVSDPNNPTLLSSSVGFGYVRDSRNLPLFPTQGSYLSYDIQFAGGPMGGDVAYRRHLVNLNYYLPLIEIKGWSPALALKTTFGQINASKPLDVPLSERFRPGGISFDGQIRGYYDYGVGPKDEYGRSTGGFTMLITSAEVSFPIVNQQIYALAFADAGNAWRNLTEMNPYELRRSAGLGVRFIIPLAGVIGLDFAYGFDHSTYTGGGWQTHFQIGPAVFR